MSRWFRVYEDLVDDPKVQLLSADCFRFLINLWCLSSANNGVIPDLKDVAFRNRIRIDRARRLLAELVDNGLIDETNEGLAPHNWGGRQFKSDVSNERVKRHRQQRRNVTQTVTETPPETETETETETERTRTLSAAPTVAVQNEFKLEGEQPPEEPSSTNGHGKYPDAFEELWAEYRVVGTPNASKADAFKRWSKLKPPDRQDCFAGFCDYAVWLMGERKKRPDYPAKHLATFITERGWESFQEAR